jgi:DNA replication protein DnaC
MEVSKPETVMTTVNCPEHGDYEYKTRYILNRPIIGNKECPKCWDISSKENSEADAKRRAREREYALQKQKRDLQDAANVPDRYWVASLRNFEATTPTQKSVLKRVTEYCEKWPEKSGAGTSMMLLGTPGTGKTHLACSVIFEVTLHCQSAYFTTVADFSRAIRATYSPAAKETEGDVLDRFAGYHFLAIDEVGSSSGSDHEKQALFDLINRRYNAVRPTMLLTNLSLEEVREFLGARIMDRLREGGGKVLVLDWESYRK